MHNYILYNFKNICYVGVNDNANSKYVMQSAGGFFNAITCGEYSQNIIYWHILRLYAYCKN